ncbi:MAG: pseudaminic acid cytidylyltransferase [Planctomycetaceae bacterium]|nr:pseudaminic acid cytidylyltransferase [Planctomycetaceae bacterium]
MNIAIIPARGGSKRIPKKNIRNFCGKPMIAYPILTAMDSGLFDRVYVSTDSDEIAFMAEQYGAIAPFRRPAQLSDDHAPTLPVIRHAVDWISSSNVDLDSVCCIYPTTPFLQKPYLQKGFDLLQAHPEADFAFSVTTFEAPIFRSLKIVNGRVEMCWPEYEQTRSQDLETVYHDAGQFYWGTPHSFRECTGLFTAHSLPVILPRTLTVDIDTPEDWDVAELMYQARILKSQEC